MRHSGSCPVAKFWRRPTQANQGKSCFYNRLEQARQVRGMCSFVARVGPIAVGAMTLAAACAPTEPTVRAADQGPPIALVSAPSKPMAADANARLAELIEGAPKSVA